MLRSQRVPEQLDYPILERIGEDVSEKLDYTPGVFEVERHVRGKWVCRRCERLIQAPVPPHVIAYSGHGRPPFRLMPDQDSG